MKFEKTTTSYAIVVPEGDFLYLMDSESYATDHAAYKKGQQSLSEKLDKLDGVFDVDYNGHFGAQIILTIDVEQDDAKLKRKIISIIKKHLKWCKSLELVDWVKDQRSFKNGKKRGTGNPGDEH